MQRADPRAGWYKPHPDGYRAFIPTPLPPDPPLRYDTDLIHLLSRADQAIGRLDGSTRNLLNPDLFVAMYVRREAVESSQIEGTQSSLQDVLAFELDPHTRDIPEDVEEVINYVRAMNYGLDRLSSLPLSLRLIREIHATLLEGTRGSEASPGEFRSSQNWIGAGTVSLGDATFVPPPVDDMHRALSDLETFLHQHNDMPTLVHCALANVQFETIHPFLDGNGRVGRLLIAFLLVHREVLHRPLLYVSAYLKRHRTAYYEHLMAVRHEGDWEGWIAFFLRGVAETAEEANDTAEQIRLLQERHRTLLHHQGATNNELRLLDLLYRRPLVNARLVQDELGVSGVTANRAIDRLMNEGLLEEITGYQRYRVYRYRAYWALFQGMGEATQHLDPPQETASSDGP